MSCAKEITYQKWKHYLSESQHLKATNKYGATWKKIFWLHKKYINYVQYGNLTLLLIEKDNRYMIF